MLPPLPIHPLAQKSLRYWYQLSDTCGAIACSIISSSTKIWTGQPEATEKLHRRSGNGSARCLEFTSTYDTVHRSLSNCEFQKKNLHSKDRRFCVLFPMIFYYLLNSLSKIFFFQSIAYSISSS
jgi:hypothetical protein